MTLLQHTSFLTLRKLKNRMIVKFLQRENRNYGLSAPGLSAPHLGPSAPGLVWCKFCCVSMGIHSRSRI